MRVFGKRESILRMSAIINNKFKSRLLQLLGLNSNLIQNGFLQNHTTLTDLCF